MHSNADAHETDPRFPSGAWVGYFLQKWPPLGRQAMELSLTFRDGNITGEGRDIIGTFSLCGHYQLEDGRCDWVKQYHERHAVQYRGFNEGKGIWGVWQIPKDGLKGGFQIWPKGMSDPTAPTLSEEADLPAAAAEEVHALEPAAAP